LDHRGQLGQQGSQARLVIQVQLSVDKVLLELLGPQGQMDSLGLPDHRVNQVQEVSLEDLAQLVVQAILEIQETLDRLETQELLEIPAPLAPQETTDLMAVLGPLDSQDLLDQLVPLVHPVQEVQSDSQDFQVPLVTLETPGVPVPQDHKETLVILEQLAEQADQETLDLTEETEVLEPRDHLAPQGHQEDPEDLEDQAH